MCDGLTELIDRMAADLDRLRRCGDARAFFHSTYLRTTRAIAEEIDRGGFSDNAWLERWDIAFAELYLDALAADLRGDPVPGPWRVAFDTARDATGLSPLRHVLLGMNAHINYDLPQALIRVIGPAEFDDPGLLRRRAADHHHVDEVLMRRVAAEDTELGHRIRLSPLDRLLRPANRAATRRLLVEARTKVWHNTGVLDQARRVGGDRYDAALSALSALCTARLNQLTAPGQVLLKLAWRGFGVRLPETAGAAGTPR